MNNWVTLLYTQNFYNIISQLYSNKVKISKNKCCTTFFCCWKQSYNSHLTQSKSLTIVSRFWPHLLSDINSHTPLSLSCRFCHSGFLPVPLIGQARAGGPCSLSLDCSSQVSTQLPHLLQVFTKNHLLNGAPSPLTFPFSLLPDLFFFPLTLSRSNAIRVLLMQLV